MLAECSEIWDPEVSQDVAGEPKTSTRPDLLFLLPQSQVPQCAPSLANHYSHGFSMTLSSQGLCM